MSGDVREDVLKLVDGNRSYTAACSSLIKTAEEHSDIDMLMDILAIIGYVDTLQKTFISVLDDVTPVVKESDTTHEDKINEDTG